jgi:hypothetical protein
MIHFTLFDILVLFAGLAFPFVAAIGIPIVFAIFVTRAWRRNRIARRWAWGFVATVAAFGIVGAPYIIYVASELLASYEQWLRRETLTEPRTIKGNVYPVGAKLQLGRGGHVLWGELPTTTLLNGLPLIGFFRFVDGPLPRLSDAPGPWLAEATLARASLVEAIPCAEGPIMQSPAGELTCRLSENFEFLGYPLAANSTIVASPGLADDATWKFGQGTLAKPLTMFRITWPPGTIVKPNPLCKDCLQASKLNDASPAGTFVHLCLPKNGFVMIGAIELHGVVEVNTGNGFFIYDFCPEYSDDPPGYTLYSSDRFRLVEIDANGKVVRTEPLR